MEYIARIVQASLLAAAIGCGRGVTGVDRLKSLELWMGRVGDDRTGRLADAEDGGWTAPWVWFCRGRDQAGGGASSQNQSPHKAVTIMLKLPA